MAQKLQAYYGNDGRGRNNGELETKQKVKMKQTIILIAIVGLFTMATTQAQTLQTNLVQTLNIQLFGLKQGTTTTNGNYVITPANVTTLGSGEIINAIGTATGNTFSSAATLVVVTPLPNGTPGVQVEDGTNFVDVSSFFSFQPLSGSVFNSFSNTRTGRSSSSSYSIEQFVLQDGTAPLNVHFNVNGLATENFFENATLSNFGELNVSVTGSGDRNGSLLILQGSIRIRGHTLQVVVTNPGGNT